MSSGQRRGYTAPYRHDGLGIQLSLLAHPDRDVGAAHELHHYEAAIPRLEKIVDGDDVRMGKPADRLHLPAHALARDVRVGRRRHQQLDGDIGFQLVVTRGVHDGEAATADLTHDLVALLQHSPGRQVSRTAQPPGHAVPAQPSPSSSSTVRALRVQPSF